MVLASVAELSHRTLLQPARPDASMYRIAFFRFLVQTLPCTSHTKNTALFAAVLRFSLRFDTTIACLEPSDRETFLCACQYIVLRCDKVFQNETALSRCLQMLDSRVTHSQFTACVWRVTWPMPILREATSPCPWSHTHPCSLSAYLILNSVKGLLLPWYHSSIMVERSSPTFQWLGDPHLLAACRRVGLHASHK